MTVELPANRALQPPASSQPTSNPPLPNSPPASPLPSPAQNSSYAWAKHFHRSRSAQGFRKRTDPNGNRYQEEELSRRDSALTPSSSATSGKRPHSATHKSRTVDAVPIIIVHNGLASKQESPDDSADQLSTSKGATMSRGATASPTDFLGLTTTIPTGGLGELSSPDKIKFSKRGSMMIDGKRLTSMAGAASKPDRRLPALRENPPSNRIAVPSRASARVLSTDEVTLSQKVRSMYEQGGERAADGMDSALTERADDNLRTSRVPDTLVTEQQSYQNGTQNGSRRLSIVARQPHELAGGIEDWQDVSGGEVDRYGFIIPKSTISQGSNKTGAAFESPGVQRTTTALLEASASPRRKLTVRRQPSGAKSHKHANGTLGKLAPAGKSTASINSYRSQSSFLGTTNPLRYAANRLPHNRDRRWMEEASDMLTLPPGLAQLAEEEEGGKAVTALKKKEWDREEKWRKMGTATQRSVKGGGMYFEFDPKDAKVLSRTWKGIPDRWRASAWYSFLAASEATHKKGLDDEQLIDCFVSLQEENSADDVQIDCDVPRTINRHIMFRRRYRGGQRLLFRVLHAMSLFFPDTGYVQGMAALAATLLCYYEEEYAFVMMVRLWQLRGLERLYQAGFDGLMDALKDFEENWLEHGDVAAKLHELGVASTSYGTRWYLTLFNYSIPFPAQLRVWDVFMLLGDLSNATDHSNEFHADLDVLHATSAALIDATREILLDSDFENAMKVLTSWIPIKDEDLMMKVALAEWKARKRRAA